MVAGEGGQPLDEGGGQSHGTGGYLSVLVILLKMMATLMITTVVNLFYDQVTWYTCTTSSILPCKELKPFLESYEVAFGLNSNYILITWVLSVQLFYPGSVQQRADWLLP